MCVCMYIFTHYRRKYENVFECSSVLQYFFYALQCVAVLSQCVAVFLSYICIFIYVYRHSRPLLPRSVEKSQLH